jgi:hypothetical protein
MAKKVFVAFAIEDKTQRDLLRGQSLNTDSPFGYIDESVKEPWDNSWKTRCREVIKGTHGVIALISKNTANADGALWEINCAIEEDKPLLGVWAYSDDRNGPSAMSGQKIIPWSWDGIADFIDSL